MLTGKRAAVPENAAVTTIEPRGSSLKLLVIATCFLIITIGLVLWQPDRLGLLETGKQTASVAPVSAPTEPTPEPVPEQTAAAPLNAPLAAALRRDAEEQRAPQLPEYDVVARAQMPLLTVSFTPIDRVTSAVITEELRQPIRLINVGVPKRDLPQLTDDVLALLSPTGAGSPDALKDLLNEAIRQRQSDAYIRVLLNTGVERGTFDIPPTLRTTDGAFDAYSLLKAMAQTAGTPVPVIPEEVETNGIQKIVPGDSLARLALRYYGQPLKYDLILAANPQINPANPVLTPGDVIQMPRP